MPYQGQQNQQHDKISQIEDALTQFIQVSTSNKKEH